MNEQLIEMQAMSPELKAIIKELKAYCANLEHGRKKEVADALGVSPSALWNILNRGQEPTGSQTLKILEILGRLK